MAKTKTANELFELYLQEYRRRYSEGDNLALLLAVDHCHRCGKAVPADLATDFSNRTDKWFRNQVRTLDEALGVERPKGQHFDDLKKRSCDGMLVLQCAMRLRVTQNLPMGGELYTAVAKELRLTERYVRALLYDKQNKILRQYLLSQYKIPRKRPVSR
jgi:hypothetical protein